MCRSPWLPREQGPVPCAMRCMPSCAGQGLLQVRFMSVACTTPGAREGASSSRAGALAPAADVLCCSAAISRTRGAQLQAVPHRACGGPAPRHAPHGAGARGPGGRAGARAAGRGRARPAAGVLPLRRGGRRGARRRAQRRPWGASRGATRALCRAAGAPGRAPAGRPRRAGRTGRVRGVRHALRALVPDV